MTVNGWLQIALYCAIILALTRPLGGFLTKVYAGERTFLTPIAGPLERGLYAAAGVRPDTEQRWTTYGLAMLAFHVAGFAAVYAILRLQGALPLNPQGFAGVTPDLAFNTAVSFVTNTNWQSYGGESTMSYGAQMWALTVQNFLSAATGMALAVALVRGFARRSAKGVGNFWADMTRSVLYVLLPISIVLALAYVALGVPQTLNSYVTATTLEGAQQTIAVGPVASQLAIKMLGTNGGGFFNANSAHPFENPSALANLIQMVSIFAIGAALTNVFGRIVGDERQGWAILAAMGAIFVVGVAITYWAEAAGNPIHTALGLDPSAGNMEGKEVRFGLALSSLFAVITTAASCGAVIAMHDSFTAIGGMIPMINMMLGEVVIGGVGAGLYGMLLFAIVAVFVAGLMVGRTPEYVGKKIEAREVKLTMLALLCVPFGTLPFLAYAAVSPLGLVGVQEPGGPHGFSEMLYAYTSAAANNGSAFAGLTANSVFWNVTLGVGMLIGRFAMIVPMLAIAGSLAGKAKIPPSLGFVGLLVGVVLIVGGLTYFPALALGPIADQLATLAGSTF
jgi:K+-transporting ATPase ATPase A chain